MSLQKDTKISFWSDFGFKYSDDLKILKKNKEMKDIMREINQNEYRNLRDLVEEQLDPFFEEIEKFSDEQKIKRALLKQKSNKRIMTDNDDFDPKQVFEPKNKIEEVGEYVKLNLPTFFEQKNMVKYLFQKCSDEQLEDIINYLQH